MKYLALMLYFCVVFANANEMPTLSINIAWDEPEKSFVQAVVQEMFKRAEMKVNIQVMPNKRSLINANSGVDDGDATRVWEINEYYPNLIRVPVENFKIELVAVTNRELKIENPLDLHQHNVGVINGMKIAVLMAEQAKPVSLIKVSKYETLLKMLAADRLDVAIVNKVSLFRYIDKIKDSGLYLNTKPLMTRPLYMQLHKKNKKYIPRLQAAMESMHTDGTYMRIYTELLGEFEAELSQALTVMEETVKTTE